MTAVLELWPLWGLVVLLAAAPWVRRRNWVEFARRYWTAHPSSEQANRIDQARIDLCADIATDLRTCSLLAEAAGNDCRARAFETAAEIAETAYQAISEEET